MEYTLSSNERLIIEPMTEADLEWVTALEEKTFSMPWSREAFAEEIGLSDRLFVVARLYPIGTDTLVNVGYSGMFISFDEAEITNVAVDSTFRQRGIGYLMLQGQLSMAAEEKGVSSFTLEVRVSNVDAIRLYEKLGFETVGIRKNFYQRPTEDAMIMWKR